MLPGDYDASEVFFKPVPNDGTRPSFGAGEGTSAFQISVVVRQSGKYQVELIQRRGSEELLKKERSM